LKFKQVIAVMSAKFTIKLTIVEKRLESNRRWISTEKYAKPLNARDLLFKWE
jgi:hypothetical protein